MRLRVFHLTRYQYPTPASDSHNEVRLMPLSDRDQTCLDFRLSTSPESSISAYDIPSGRVHNFNVKAAHRELVIRAEALVLTYRQNPFKQFQLISDDMAFYARQDIRQNYYEYLQPTQRVPLTPETDRIAVVAKKQAGPSAASFLISLTRQLHRAFAYTPGATNVNTSLQQVLENRQGVCQDFAHLMLSVCRRQSIPARYVSGYLYTGQKSLGEKSPHSGRGTEETLFSSGDRGQTSLSAPTSAASAYLSTPPRAAHTENAPLSDKESKSEKRIDANLNRDFESEFENREIENREVEQRETENREIENREIENEEAGAGHELVGGNAMHAWIECLLPDGQWHGFDPTNNIVTNDHYIKVHHGLDYGAVTPIRGLYHGPFAHNLEVAVQVFREADLE